MKLTFEEVHAHPIFRALNPEIRRFMEVRWLPQELNPFLKPYGINIAALIPFTVFPHIKSIPTWRMMVEDFKGGLYDGMHTIVVDSSGNTAHAVARLARAFGFKKVKAVMSTDVPDSKSSILRALASVDVIQVGDVANTAREEGQKPGHYHLNQYSHMGNVRAHELYTGPEIVRVLGDRMPVIAVAMGSGGTVTGVSRFLKRRDYDSTFVIGVQPSAGEQVPGARDAKRMDDVVTLPWRNSVDYVCTVSRKESFTRMRQLWSAVEPQPGPTSGLAWGGLMHYLENCNPIFLNAQYRGKVLAFICPDDGRFYPERTTGELDTDQGL